MIPSIDFFALTPEKFQELFREWIKSLPSKINHIAIDGNTAYHSFDGDGPILHMISAYATEDSRMGRCNTFSHLVSKIFMRSPWI